MASFSFVTTWVLDAPADEVFEVLHDFRAWPEWWPGVLDVTLENGGNGGGIGAVVSNRWRSRLPYTVEFDMCITRIERPWLVSGAASGELEGRGTWRLFEAGGATAVVYEWDVRTTRWWMNLVAPFTRRVLEWNHDCIMAAGGRGLAKRLGVELVVAT